MTNKKHMYTRNTRNIRNAKNIRKMMKNATKITKKYKDHSRNKKLSIGGADLSNDQTASEIMNEVKNERKFNINNFSMPLANVAIIKKTAELAEGLIIKGIDEVGLLLGVDLYSSQSIGDKLEEIKMVLADPKNKEKLKEIVSEAAKVGSVAIEAATPFIEPLLEKTVKLGRDAMTKIGESAVKIGMNTAEEIPGVGVVIGTVRSLSDAGEAVLAASNAATEVITTTSDSINAATKNFERLMKEKMDGLNRISDSVNKFQQPFNRVKQMQIPNMANPMKNIPNPMTNAMSKISGGTTRKYKKSTKHTKTHKTL